MFGAPLAIEALLAFFLESTFLGLWIFGWDRLPPAAAPGRIWLVAIGTQPVGVLHPGRQLLDAAPGRLPGQPGHPPGRADRLRRGADQPDRRSPPSRTRSSPAFITAGAFDAWRSAPGSPGPRARDLDVCRPAMRLGLVVTLLAGVAVAVTGRRAGPVMTEQQPMKMAAAEALYDHRSRRLVLAVHDRLAERRRRSCASIRVPDLLSFLATGDLARHRSRASTTSGAATQQEVRPRRLHARHPGDLLVVPADDRPRLLAALLAAGRPVADPAARRCRGQRAGSGVDRAVAPRRCRWRPTRSAGSSPRWAASRGSSSAC